MVDALSRKPMASLSSLLLGKMQLLEQFARLDLTIKHSDDRVLVSNIKIQSDLLEEIKAQQDDDPFLVHVKETLTERPDFAMTKTEGLSFKEGHVFPKMKN